MWPDVEGLVEQARAMGSIPEGYNIESLVTLFQSPIPAVHDAGATALRALRGWRENGY